MINLASEGNSKAECDIHWLKCHFDTNKDPYLKVSFKYFLLLFVALWLVTIGKTYFFLLKIHKEVGFEGSFEEFCEYMKTDPKFFFNTSVRFSRFMLIENGETYIKKSRICFFSQSFRVFLSSQG